MCETVGARSVVQGIQRELSSFGQDAYGSTSVTRASVPRPNDSRMLVALGESYEKLSQQVEAKKVSDVPPLI